VDEVQELDRGNEHSARQSQPVLLGQRRDAQMDLLANDGQLDVVFLGVDEGVSVELVESHLRQGFLRPVRLADHAKVVQQRRTQLREALEGLARARARQGEVQVLQKHALDEVQQGVPVLGRVPFFLLRLEVDLDLFQVLVQEHREQLVRVDQPVQVLQVVYVRKLRLFHDK